MKGFIDNINFYELEAMKYYAPPASWSQEKKEQTAKSRIFSGEWYGARKRDGSWWMFIKDEDGNMFLRGRSKGVDGTYPDKIEWVPHLNSFFSKLPNKTVLLGELYLPSKEQSRYVTTILGCLKEKAVERQNKGEKLKFYVFDVLAYNDDIRLSTEASARFSKLESLKSMYPDPNIEWASYVTGEELWTTLQTILADGGEGMVITRGGAPYQPGKRPSGDTLKVKKEIQETIDCFFTGKATSPSHEYNGKEIQSWTYWENLHTGEMIEGLFYKDYTEGKPIIPVTKPYFKGWAGSLEIGLWDGEKVVPIGFLSGVADELKANWKEQKGKVIEVAAMQIESDTKALRHGKMLGFRADKNWKDCTIDQLK